MAIITLTVQTGDVQTILDAYRYDPTSGETAVAFMKRKIIEDVQSTVVNYKKEQAVNQAREANQTPPNIT